MARKLTFTSTNLPSRVHDLGSAVALVDTRRRGIDLALIHCLLTSEILQGFFGDSEARTGLIDDGDVNRIGLVR